MSNEIKRMRYFNGLLLKDDDLALEQAYHMRMNRLHNRYFHNWGIVYGLEVTPVEKAPQVRISHGMALNRVLLEDTEEAQSQEIFIAENHPGNPVDLSECIIDKNIYITVSYEEVTADIDTIKGGDEQIHIWERAHINHAYELPTDTSKEIVLARVRLKLEEGNKSVGEISYEDKDEVNNTIMLRTSAIPNATEYEKISIGEKGKSNLPYINGLIDEEVAKGRGIEFNSPFTRFSGSLISGAIKAVGDVDIKGVLTVTANNKEALKVDSDGTLYVSKPISAKDLLSANGGLYVSGDNTNIDTSKVSVTSSLVTINKYTPAEGATEPRKQNGGIDVYRGGIEPDARLMWDETDKKWKIGTNDTEDTDDSDDTYIKGMHAIAYGKDWDTLHNKSNADLLHRHMELSDTTGNVGLSMDSSGNINIPNSVVVSGSIIVKNGGIEVPKSGDLPAGKLAWNNSTGHWQAAEGEVMVDLAYGSEWDELTNKANADGLHNHRVLYNEDGTIEAVRVNADGNIDISKNLTVKNLTVNETFTLTGQKFVVETADLVVENNVITVNKYQAGGVPNTEGGMEVYRGGVLANARIIWDEGSKRWKIGTGDSMSEIPYGIQWEDLIHGGAAENLHKHSSLYSQDGAISLTTATDGSMATYSSLSVSDGLTVENDAQIKGQMHVNGSLTVDGDLTVKGETTIINQNTLEVDDNIIVVNKFLGESNPSEEAGLEVYRGKLADKARIVWNETEEKWKFGIGNDLVELPDVEDWGSLTGKALADELHKHNILCDKVGTPVLNVNDSGDIKLSRDTEVKGEFSVDGSVTVLGNLDVSGTVTAVNKVDMQVTDNVITLNKFEGDTPTLNESGIEIFRGNTNPKARLIWDEELDKWKLGIGSELKEIICGDIWNKLIEDKNADNLHLHGQLYNEQGNILSLSTSAGGNVNVANALSVGQSLTVIGNLEVNGSLTSINSEMFEVRGNNIILNRYEADIEPPKVQSGLKIFRGKDNPNAGIMWDENNKSWKVGLIDKQEGVIKDGLVVNSDGSLGVSTGIIKVAGNINAASATIDGSFKVKDGMEIVRDTDHNAQVKWDETLKQWIIGTEAKTGIIVQEGGKVTIGNDEPEDYLNVNGNVIISKNAKISGSITTVEGATINGDIKSTNGHFDGNLIIDGNLVSSKGLEVDSGKDANGNPLPIGRLLWDKDKKVWLFGMGDNLEELAIAKYENDHTHSCLYAGSSLTVFTGIDGKVGIGTDKPQSKLHVIGNALVDGNISGTTLTSTKLEVNGSAAVTGKLSAKDVAVSGSLTVTQGIEIDRGTDSKAQIIWNGSKWQAGTADNLAEISLMGHTHLELSDKIHTHQKLVNTAGADALIVDATGNIGIIGDAKVTGTLSAANAEISGSLTVTQGIEIDRGTDAKAQIIWNGSKWQAGTADNLVEISLMGHTHLELSDKIHTHQKLVNTAGADALIVDATGNIGISGDAKVTGTLSAANAEISGSLTVTQGIEIDRGTDAKAQIIWNDSKWQAGTADNLAEISLMGHTHLELSDKIHTHQKLVNTAGADALIVDATGNIGISGDAKVTGTLSAANAEISGSLTVTQGIEIDRGTDAKAQIMWDGSKWMFGTADALTGIEYSGHKHQGLYTSSNVEAVTVDTNGNVSIGKTSATAIKLEVAGDVTAATLSQASSSTNTQNIASLSIETAIELLSSLVPVSYDYLAGSNKTSNIGFIAENVPDKLATSDHKAVVLMDIIGVLTTVVKNQQQEITTAKSQITELQTKVTALENA